MKKYLFFREEDEDDDDEVEYRRRLCSLERLLRYDPRLKLGH